MDQEEYRDDLRHIRSMMSRSSKFLSLSGFSGICAGVFSLLGAYIAYKSVFEMSDFHDYQASKIPPSDAILLIFISGAVIILTIITGIYFNSKEARKQNQKLWDSYTQEYLSNLAVPLLAGGILCCILLIRGYIGLLAPMTLIFYGLALINASHFSLRETYYLGILQIGLGLLSVYFLEYGLIIWAIGFGVVHIIHGIYMHSKN